MPKSPKRILKRGGIYYVRLYAGGKEYRRSLKTGLLTEAKRRARLILPKLREEANRIAERDPEAPSTVEEFSQKWLTEYVAQQRKGSGLALARQRMQDHTLPIIGKVQLERLRVSHFRSLRASLQAKEGRAGKGLSSGSIRHILGDVRTLLRYAVDCGCLSRSPWSRDVMPKLEETIPEPLSAEQVDAILRATPKKYELGVRMALLTGLRWSELRRLQWENVKDLPFPHLIIRKTKSKKDRRVPLLPEAVRLLEPLRKSSGQVLAGWKTPYCGTAVETIRNRSKVHFTWHQFRHTFACRWLEQGGSKETLQKILGHSTILLTERYGRMGDEAVYAEVLRLRCKTGSKTGSPPTAESSGIV